MYQNQLLLFCMYVATNGGRKVNVKETRKHLQWLGQSVIVGKIVLLLTFPKPCIIEGQEAMLYNITKRCSGLVCHRKSWVLAHQMKHSF